MFGSSLAPVARALGKAAWVYVYKGSTSIDCCGYRIQGFCYKIENSHQNAEKSCKTSEYSTLEIYHNKVSLLFPIIIFRVVYNKMLNNCYSNGFILKLPYNGILLLLLEMILNFVKGSRKMLVILQKNVIYFYKSYT